VEDYIKNYKNLKSRFFALKNEDGKGVQYQITLIEGGEEEGGVLTETMISAWSDPIEKGGGFSWYGTLESFMKSFKYIGFEKKGEK